MTFQSFSLKAKKKGDVYKFLKLRPTHPDDMGDDFDQFIDETILLYNTCEPDGHLIEKSIFVKVKNNGNTDLCEADDLEDDE